MSNNILEPLVDAVYDVVALLFKIIFKTKDTFDIEKFFKICKLKIVKRSILFCTKRYS